MYLHFSARTQRCRRQQQNKCLTFAEIFSLCDFLQINFNNSFAFGLPLYIYRIVIVELQEKDHHQRGRSRSRITSQMLLSTTIHIMPNHTTHLLLSLLLFQFWFRFSCADLIHLSWCFCFWWDGLLMLLCSMMLYTEPMVSSYSQFIIIIHTYLNCLSGPKISKYRGNEIEMPSHHMDMMQFFFGWSSFSIGEFLSQLSVGGMVLESFHN